MSLDPWATWPIVHAGTDTGAEGGAPAGAPSVRADRISARLQPVYSVNLSFALLLRCIASPANLTLKR